MTHTLLRSASVYLNAWILMCTCRCTAASVQKRHVAIARLRSPAYIGRTCQEVWFIILVVTSTKEVTRLYVVLDGRLSKYCVRLVDLMWTINLYKATTMCTSQQCRTFPLCSLSSLSLSLYSSIHPQSQSDSASLRVRISVHYYYWPITGVSIDRCSWHSNVNRPTRVSWVVHSHGAMHT